MKICFFGTPAFSASILKHLAEGPHEVCLAVCQPDKPAGRRRKLHHPETKITALELGIPCIQPYTLKDESSIEPIRTAQPDLFVVVAYGKILPRNVLDIPRLYPVNIHASLLPHYRGAGPIQRSLINGDSKTGITTIVMDEHMDAGDILIQRSIDIDPEDTCETLSAKLIELSKLTIDETIAGIENGSITPVSQNESKATFAPKITKEDCLIDWNSSAEIICNLIRGLSPAPAAHAKCALKQPEKEMLLKIIIAVPVVTMTGSPGTVLFQDKNGICVATGIGAVLIKELVPEGKNSMTAAAFTNGYEIAAFLIS